MTEDPGAERASPSRQGDARRLLFGKRKGLEIRQALLLGLVDRFHAALDPLEIATFATEAVGRELEASRVVYGHFDPAPGEVGLEAEWTAPGVPPLFPATVPLGRLATGGARADRPIPSVSVEDLAKGDPSFGIGVPLSHEGRIMALFHVGSAVPRAWSPEDVDFAHDVARRMWDAAEQSRATALLRRNQARQGFLLVLGDRLRELSEPAEIKETVSEALGRQVKAEMTAYGELDPQGVTLTFEAGWTDGDVAPLEGSYPLQDLGRIAVDDLERGLSVVVEPAADAASPIRGMPALVVPLIRDGRLRAVLMLGVRSPRHWSAEELALAGEVAARMWETLERARTEIALRELNATLEQRVAQRTAELTESEARFRTLFENAPASIVLIRIGTGDQFVYEAVNEAAERFLGRSAHTLLGRPVAEGGDGSTAFLARCRECVASGLPVHFEVTLETSGGKLTADGVLAPLPVEDAGGRLLIGISRDITAQRRAEEQLRQAQKMEAIGQLTGGIAHDFNNLLTGIIGSIALLQKRLEQGRIDTLERYAGMALTSANRAAALTHRLLAFSRRQPLEAKPTDANQLVASMDDLLRRTLGKTVLLETVLAGDLWPALCDPHQLENAVLNLAINARDAMPDGGRLTIATAKVVLDEEFAAREPGMRAGEYVKLSVADTGTGMPPETIARAFDPFFTTKPIGQGTGLGLSMIYGFVKQSEGYTRITSEVGRGTIVELYLPRVRGHGEESAEAHTGPTPRAEAGETVLVVEDDPTVRGLVLDVLSELGYTALQAPDGPAGLGVLQTGRRIDLLVTDVGLPGMNGRQLAEQARIGRPGLKVLFVTGYAEDAAFGAGHLDPDLQMMTKPFTVEALATRIRAMLEVV